MTEVTEAGTVAGTTTTGHDVRVTGAGKHYGAVAALRSVDLEVTAGQFLVLLGPSGSGKSTLARSLAGVERLDTGTVRIGGRTVADGPLHLAPEHRDLAMVFQDYALWPHMSVLDNVGYALARRRLGRAESGRRSREVLERVGLAAHAARYPHELSGGEQQRVALARAVVARPGLLLFDEPLSNLDADLRERLRVEISTLTRESGATAVYITHDQAEAFALADRIGVLEKGALVQLGPPEAIYRNPANLFVARFTGLAGELAGTVRSTGDGTVEADVAGARLVAQCPAGVPVGGQVTVAVRPAATHFLEPGRVPAGGLLRGTVTDVAYRGRGYDHVVHTPGGELTAVFSPVAHERGSAVEVEIDAAGSIAYPCVSDQK